MTTTTITIGRLDVRQPGSTEEAQAYLDRRREHLDPSAFPVARNRMERRAHWQVANHVESIRSHAELVAEGSPVHGSVNPRSAAFTTSEFPMLETELKDSPSLPRCSLYGCKYGDSALHR